ncbi:hypothetical protein Dimus_005651 [Dionaea muscipula]
MVNVASSYEGQESIRHRSVQSSLSLYGFGHLHAGACPDPSVAAPATDAIGIAADSVDKSVVDAGDAPAASGSAPEATPHPDASTHEEEHQQEFAEEEVNEKEVEA